MLEICDRFIEVDVKQLFDVYQETLLNKMRKYCLSRFRVECDLLEYMNECFFPRVGSFYAFWVVDGVYVSALRCEVYEDGYLITALETTPQLRNHGYAKILLENVLNYLRESNRLPVYSHVSKRNFPSLKVHECCGFQRIYGYGKLIDGTVSNNCYTLKYNI